MDWLLTYADPTIDWNYAMVTLLVRFIGVFVVMAVIQVALQLSSRLVAVAERRGEAGRQPGAGARPPAPPEPSTTVPEAAPGLDDATVAAIAAALALEAGAGAVPATPGDSSAWSVAGRIRQLHRPLPRA